jgi:hypothetical protein
LTNYASCYCICCVRTVEIGDSLSSVSQIAQLHNLQDVNDEQQCILGEGPTQASTATIAASAVKKDNMDSITTGRVLRITFRSSTDFYGRVTVYKLEAIGYEMTATDIEVK